MAATHAHPPERRGRFAEGALTAPGPPGPRHGGRSSRPALVGGGSRSFAAAARNRRHHRHVFVSPASRDTTAIGWAGEAASMLRKAGPRSLESQERHGNARGPPAAPAVRADAMGRSSRRSGPGQLVVDDVGSRPHDGRLAAPRRGDRWRTSTRALPAAEVVRAPSGGAFWLLLPWIASERTPAVLERLGRRGVGATPLVRVNTDHAARAPLVGQERWLRSWRCLDAFT